MNNRDQQRGERRKNSAKREIAKDPEGMKEREQLFVEQPVKQENSGSVRGFRLILQARMRTGLWMRRMRCRAHLLGQFGFKRLLAVCDVGFVPGGIDECIVVAALEAVVLPQHAEICTVRSQENIARQAFELFELAPVVGRDLRVAFIVNKLIARVYVRASHYNDMKNAAVFLLVQSPRGGAPGCPAVRCAVSVVPPNDTALPSWSTRSTFVAGNHIDLSAA